ncbi:MAG: KH domain-containing protein [Candidatus Micrarchaeia archaeon]
MEQILIPSKRMEILKKHIGELSRVLNCKIRINEENEVVLDGGAYEEYNAKNVVTAIGGGFDVDAALRLINDGYFFKSINLKEIFKNRENIIRIEGRVIGREGKSKIYIEEVSGAKISVFGSNISIIGTDVEIKIAESAIYALIEGDTHRKAYRIMEMTKKKMKMV